MRSSPLHCNCCSKLLVAAQNLQAITAFPEQRLRPTQKTFNCISLPAVEKTGYQTVKVPFVSLNLVHTALAFGLVFCVLELRLFSHEVQASSSYKNGIWPFLDQVQKWIKFSAPKISDDLGKAD